MGKCCIVFILLVGIVCSEKVNAASSHGAQIFKIFMFHGMNLLHRGKDYYDLDESISLKHFKFEDVRIFNLQSVRPACELNITKTSTSRGQVKRFVAEYRCFRVIWCLAFDELRAEGRSKVKIFFASKFYPITLTVRPFSVQLRTQVCFPFLQSAEGQPAPSLNSTREAAIIFNLEDVKFTQWQGVRLKGDGTANKIAGFLINNRLANLVIRKLAERRIRRMVPEKIEKFFERIYDKVDSFVHRLVEKYSTPITEEDWKEKSFG